VRIIVRLSTMVEKSYDYFTVTYKKNIELNLLYRKIKRPRKNGSLEWSCSRKCYFPCYGPVYSGVPLKVNDFSVS
jgi:hypothetical protein